MKKLVVNDKYNGKKLSKFILDNVSTLNFNKFCMVLRKKDIKIGRAHV